MYGYVEISCCAERKRREIAVSSHGHLSLQFPELFFLVFLLGVYGCFACSDWFVLAGVFPIARVFMPRLPPSGAVGSLWILSAGTLPVPSILLSNSSCCSASSSSSNSDSSKPELPIDCVIASPISSPMACCSRSSSLHGLVSHYIFHGTEPETDLAFNAHCLVHFVDSETAMDLLHCRAGVLHGIKSLLVNICRLDAVNLALECHYLSSGLVKGVLKLFLPSECGFRSCTGSIVSRILIHVSRRLQLYRLFSLWPKMAEADSPFLLVFTYFLAKVSCSSI